MAIIKVLEIMSNSTKSWEDATQNAVKHAAKTVKNIKSVYVKEQTAVVSGENISEYSFVSETEITSSENIVYRPNLNSSLYTSKILHPPQLG